MIPFKQTHLFLLILFLIYSSSAIAGEIKQCVTVKNTGADLAGENMICGQCGYSGGVFGFGNYYGCIQCGTVRVNVPSGTTILRVDRNFDTGGWAEWLDKIKETDGADGSTSYETTLKNWSKDLSPKACLIATIR